MATPSSSATSPSPPISYLAHTSQPLHPSSPVSMDSSEKELRKKAVQKFLARAEISMVTRALRARLSYASYKATHNVPHLSLRDLEARSFSHSQLTLLPRTITSKRKAATTTNHRENTTGTIISTSGLTMAGSAHRRGGSNSMAPPAAVSAPRSNNYPTANGNTSTDSGPNSRSGNTLYTSILAPPPSKQARTIHNVKETPIPSTAPAPSPRSRVSRAEGRGRGRGKATGRATKVSETTTSRRRKTSSIDKGKQKQALIDAEMNVDVDGDVDMKAAATLTSWLLHNRQPNVAGSPRSSFDGSETGSTYSHFAQSSTRTTTTTTTATAVSAASPAAASTTSVAEPPARSRTPSPPSKPAEHATPRAAPTDDEAVDLMLLFATSPSPVRPTTVGKEARDMAAFRTLSGGNNALLSKGRVLFPSLGDMSGTEELSPDSGRSQQRRQYRHQHTKSGPPLMRGGDNSFSSSVSSITSQLGGRRGSADASGLPRIASTSHLGPSQLLPPPPLPIIGMTTPEHAASATQSPKSSGGQTADFNFSDFINASPSPARAGTGQMLSLGQSIVGSGAPKPSLGLRADVGRKLFEEEQMRNAMGSNSGVDGTKSPGVKGLGAGIELDAKHS